MEEIKKELGQAKILMEKIILHTKEEFKKTRAGKASPSLLEGVRVEYYGNLVPLNQVASVNNIDGRTLAIKPWDKSLITAIEKGILKSHLDFNPQNDGEVILIVIPPLTEESRSKLLKQIKQEAEKGKVSLRNARKDIKDKLKNLKNNGASEDLIHDAEEDLQKLVDESINQIEYQLNIKEKDVMEI